MRCSVRPLGVALKKKSQKIRVIAPRQWTVRLVSVKSESPAAVVAGSECYVALSPFAVAVALDTEEVVAKLGFDAEAVADR